MFAPSFIPTRVECAFRIRARTMTIAQLRRELIAIGNELILWARQVSTPDAAGNGTPDAPIVQPATADKIRAFQGELSQRIAAEARAGGE